MAGGCRFFQDRPPSGGATALPSLVTIPLAKDLQVPNKIGHFCMSRSSGENLETGGDTHGIKTSLQPHANHYHGTSSTVPNWDCAQERDTTQPPALHDYLLGPANKSGAFFTGPVACERARCRAAQTPAPAAITRRPIQVLLAWDGRIADGRIAPAIAVAQQA